EARFDLLVGNVRAHHAKQFRPSKLNFLGRALAGIYVDNAGEQFAAGKLQDKFGTATGSELGHFRISAAAEARRGFGVQFQSPPGATNSNGVEPGAFDQDILGRERDFRLRAAHDAADAHGSRAVTIANDAYAWG